MVRCAPTSPSRAWVSSVDLPGRGTTAVWQCAGPPHAETLVLLHGVAMTAELCWFRVLEQLGRQFRIVAPDLRGHGDGIPLGGSRFRLEDSVDDIAALADVLDIKSCAVVGYSIGGWSRNCCGAGILTWCPGLFSAPPLATSGAVLYLLPFAPLSPLNGWAAACWGASRMANRGRGPEHSYPGRACLPPCRPLSRQSSSPRMSGSRRSTCPPLSLSPRPTGWCRQVVSAGWPAPSRLLLCSS